MFNEDSLNTMQQVKSQESDIEKDAWITMSTFKLQIKIFQVQHMQHHHPASQRILHFVRVRQNARLSNVNR